ncbi:MAG: bifunctional DNA-formamidopyrimidine glycosylase/DNA-(apurinic or apyrimidinic site) lyase [Deltaproteobacteria bacterium]|nr:bifunctional DNA-formamidopyrimidine glycosylase/DNA-(apurinic or apyrimidinic site) lyase [Deltaproteobacteria bacterium]
MPELPEVETTRRSLAPQLTGATITGATVRERRFRRPVDRDLEARIRNRRITAIDRRGKYLLFRLEDGATLLVHLGMSGSLTLLPPATPLAVHDHVAIATDRDVMMVFNDPRRFGLMVLGQGDDFAELRNVGRDPLDAALSVDEWKALTRGRKLPIKNLLMDQRLLGGVGNIYASEMLFQAGIRPRRRAASLTRAELARLATALQAVLARAVELGGSSISDYRDGNGNPGYFQIHHAVYDRDGQACVRCKTPIKRLVQSGRSSFYCPKCQR